MACSRTLFIFLVQNPLKLNFWSLILPDNYKMVNIGEIPYKEQTLEKYFLLWLIFSIKKRTKNDAIISKLPIN